MITPNTSNQKTKNFHTPSCIIENKQDLYNFFKEKNSDIQRVYESYILKDFQINNINVDNFHIDAATTKNIGILKKIFELSNI